MRYPGFTAEASLPVTRDRQWVGTGTMRQPPEPSIVAQNIECDIYIFCVDGIRYLKRDCPDGSGDTVAIGVCPKPRSWWFWNEIIRMGFPRLP